MLKYAAWACGLTMLSVVLIAQTHRSRGIAPHRFGPLGATATLGSAMPSFASSPRCAPYASWWILAVHASSTPMTTSNFHLFVPISGPMQVNLDGAPSVDVQPWHPYFFDSGTLHGFHNGGDTAVEIMEIFVR